MKIEKISQPNKHAELLRSADASLKAAKEHILDATDFLRIAGESWESTNLGPIGSAIDSMRKWIGEQ